MIDIYGTAWVSFLVGLFLLLYTMCSLRRAIYPRCTFWMMGMFRLLIVFIEGRHRILQRPYDAYDNLGIHFVGIEVKPQLGLNIRIVPALQ